MLRLHELESTGLRVALTPCLVARTNTAGCLKEALPTQLANLRFPTSCRLTSAWVQLCFSATKPSAVRFCLRAAERVVCRSHIEVVRPELRNIADRGGHHVLTAGM